MSFGIITESSLAPDLFPCCFVNDCMWPDRIRRLLSAPQRVGFRGLQEVFSPANQLLVLLELTQQRAKCQQRERDVRAFCSSGERGVIKVTGAGLCAQQRGARGQDPSGVSWEGSGGGGSQGRGPRCRCPVIVHKTVAHLCGPSLKTLGWKPP